MSYKSVQTKTQKGCYVIVAVVIAMGIMAWLVVFIQNTIWKAQHSSLQKELGVVCRGRGVPDAADYQSGIGPHRIFLFNKEGEFNQMSIEVPASWLSESVATTELIICIDDKELLKQTCQYSGGPPIRRYQYQMNARLFAAYTAELITVKTFYGTMPSECPNTAPKGQETIYGTSISFGDIQPWLAEIVEE